MTEGSEVLAELADAHGWGTREEVLGRVQAGLLSQGLTIFVDLMLVDEAEEEREHQGALDAVHLTAGVFDDGRRVDDDKVDLLVHSLEPLRDRERRGAAVGVACEDVRAVFLAGADRVNVHGHEFVEAAKEGLAGVESACT